MSCIWGPEETNSGEEQPSPGGGGKGEGGGGLPYEKVGDACSTA